MFREYDTRCVIVRSENYARGCTWVVHPHSAQALPCVMAMAGRQGGSPLSIDPFAPTADVPALEERFDIGA